MKYVLSALTALCAIGLLAGAGIHSELGRTYLCFGLYVLLDSLRQLVQTSPATKAVS